MEYYILYYSSQSKEIGSSFPQVGTIHKKGFDGELLNKRKELPERFCFPDFKLENRAKLTDLLSSSTMLFPAQILLSNKFFDIIKDFTAPYFQTFETRVIDKKGLRLPYKIMHQYQHMDDYIDYNKTVFELTSYDFTVSPPASEKREFQVESFEEFEFFNQSYKGSKCIKHLHLAVGNIQYDHFRTILGNLWVINEHVAKALIQEKITGLSIIPLKQGEDFCSESVVKKAQKQG